MRKFAKLEIQLSNLTELVTHFVNSNSNSNPQDSAGSSRAAHYHTTTTFNADAACSNGCASTQPTTIQFSDCLDTSLDEVDGVDESNNSADAFSSANCEANVCETSTLDASMPIGHLSSTDQSNDSHLNTTPNNALKTITAEQIEDLLENSESGSFPKALFFHFFTIDELKQPNTNVYGRVQRGESAVKVPLNPEYVNKIEKIVKAYTDGDQKAKNLAWKTAVTSVNQHMAYLRTADARKEKRKERLSTKIFT